MINRSGLIIATVSLKILKTEHHQTNLHVGSFVCIENFGAIVKSKKSFEKGDMPIVIKVESTIYVNVIQGNDHIRYFETISKF